MKLAALTAGRENNFQLIRFVAATAVIVFHCYALTNRWTDEPLWRIAPEFNLGVIGVGAFFVASGFLVTQSWLQRARMVAFAAARALRIYPALIAATLTTILLAGISGTVPWQEFLSDPRIVDYAWRTVSTWNFVATLPGAYTGNPFPGAVNGSLWTLPIEVRLYAGVMLAGLAGLLPRPRIWLATVLLLCALIVANPTWFPLAPNDATTRQLALLFLIGSIACLWRDMIPVSLTGLALAIALIALDPLGLGRGSLFPVLFAYAVLVVAYHPRLRWAAFNRLGDYSYGLYIFSFPVQQFLIAWLGGAFADSPLMLFAAAFPLTFGLAAASWHMIERPALALKSRFH